MALLGKRFLPLLLSSIIFVGCDRVTVTEVIDLETDTYISSTDLSNHAQLPVLKVSKSTAVEERAIVKIPTGKRNQKDHLDETLKDPYAYLVLPFVVFVEILERILDCENVSLNASNLTSAKLVFDISDNQEGSLSGKLSLALLSKPWWQTVSWERAHYFSSVGKWVAPGGDIDAAFATVASTQAASTVEFDITTYFKSLIQTTGSIHYGLLLKAAGATLGSVALKSTQSPEGLKPRIVATYTGNCAKSSHKDGETRVFFLDQDLPGSGAAQ